MKKKILAIVLAAVLIFALSACGVSASSSTQTSFSTSVTDSEGNTTTNTVTNEIGVSAGPNGIQTKNETKTDSTTTAASGSMADFFPPIEEWYDLYSAGGEGQNEDGDSFFFAYNDPEDVSEAILLIQFTDGDVMVRNGKVLWDEDNECLELYDADVDSTIPFIFLDTDEDGVFAVRFLANDVEVFFDIVDQDTIINDIYDILSSATPNSAIEEEEAAEFAEEEEAA